MWAGVGLEDLLDRVLLGDVADGRVLAPNATLTLHTLESFGNCLGKRHSLEGLSKICPLEKYLVEALWWTEVKTNTLAWVANMELGGHGEQRAAGYGELAFLEVWPQMEKTNSELVIDR
jgi:hypothetical protein